MTTASPSMDTPISPSLRMSASALRAMDGRCLPNVPRHGRVCRAKCAVLNTVKIVEILCKKLTCSHSQSFSRADRKWLL